jgi:hypothetical protein
MNIKITAVSIHHLVDLIPILIRYLILKSCMYIEIVYVDTNICIHIFSHIKMYDINVYIIHLHIQSYTHDTYKRSRGYRSSIQDGPTPAGSGGGGIYIYIYMYIYICIYI